MGTDGPPKGMLDRDAVRTVLDAQFPELRAREVAFLGEGWDFQAFAVDGRWVFRFPKEERDARLLVEMRFLEEIGPRLPLPAPRYQFHGRPNAGFPSHFGGYAMLPGKPALTVTLSPQALTAAAHQLGAFLDVVHAFDVARAREIGLEANDGTLAEGRADELEELEAVRHLLPSDIYASAHAFLAEESRVPPEYAGPPYVLHNDLGEEHILVDAAGRVTGVVDWTDAEFGDPALDFSRMWAWQGDAFVEAMLTQYRHPRDETWWSRVRYWGVCTPIGDLHYGWVMGDPRHAQAARSRLARIFGR